MTDEEASKYFLDYYNSLKEYLFKSEEKLSYSKIYKIEQELTRLEWLLFGFKLIKKMRNTTKDGEIEI